MNFISRYWKSSLLFIANAIYTYVEHVDIVKKAVAAEVPSHYNEIVKRHMQRAIDEQIKPKEKFPAPYFYVPGKGAIEEEQRIMHDFKKTYAYNAKVDRVMEKAGIKPNDAFSDAMQLASKYVQ